MKKINVLFLLAITTNSYAGITSFEGELNLNEEATWSIPSNQTKYQALLDAYNSATSSAELSDFPGTPISTRTCVVVKESSPDSLSNTSAAVVAKIIVAEEPGNGPLFPAKPSTLRNVLVMGQDSWIGANMDRQKLDAFTNNKTSKDLEILVSEGNSAGIYSDIEGGVKISIRKKNGYLPFKMEKISKGIPTIIYVGYCY